MVARASQIQECVVLAAFVHLQDRHQSRIEHVEIIGEQFRWHFRLVGIYGEKIGRVDLISEFGINLFELMQSCDLGIIL